MTATTAVVLAMVALVMVTVDRVLTALVMVTVDRVLTALVLVTVTAGRAHTALALATAVVLVLVTVTAVRVIGNSISDADEQVVRNAKPGSASMARGYMLQFRFEM
jgi:hypothetical protein